MALAEGSTEFFSPISQNRNKFLRRFHEAVGGCALSPVGFENERTMA
jgi:hypothetical protein